MKIKKLIVRASRAVSVFMATIICLSLLPSFNLRAEMLSNIFTYNNYNIEYNVVNEWEGYQNIEIKLTNTSSEPIYNWAFGYNAGGEIINIWNSTIYSNSGTNYVIKNADIVLAFWDSKSNGTRFVTDNCKKTWKRS